MIIDLESYLVWKENVTSKSLDHFNYVDSGMYHLLAIDGPIGYRHSLDPDNEEDYFSTLSQTSNQKIGTFYSREPFAAKVLKNGKSLFRRKHGKKVTIPAGQESKVVFSNPYDSAKINKLEVIGANSLDRIDLKVLDTPSGAISTIPNYLLNQFGFDVVVSDLIYADKSDYDADLIKDMQVEITYKNDSDASVQVGFNIIYHEVV